MTASEMIVFGLFITVGLYLIFCDLFQLPSSQAAKAAMKVTQGEKVSWHRAITERLTNTLAKQIHLDRYRRQELAATLKYAGLEQSPESYLARIIVRALFRLLWILPCIRLLPLLIPIVLLLTFNRAWDDTQSAKKIVAEKRQTIERELPRFVSTIAQEIGANRDVLALLDGYRESAGPIFRNELEITLAGMRSGSPEQALLRLAGRVGSGKLSEVIRGLLAALHGGDGVLIFSLLNNDYKKLEKQLLWKEAQKRPAKMKKYSYALMACIMATYMYVTFEQVISNIHGLF
ncbi:hypothetical protein CAFE_11310 [Caprobacter fermentans]|uniref:Secretion protein F n=1 Tax=Caproicibacter fermentans TaxID=2576756 RepID=A0A6N8HXG7_9FIRM|nr:secretion protein F [Caproicibacter fermentans]MVB10442.1 hypothetical protein [Caproicibacter fermentans]